MLEFLRHAKNAEKAGKDFVQKEKISNDKFGGRSTALQKANLPLYLSIISIIYIFFLVYPNLIIIKENSTATRQAHKLPGNHLCLMQ